jgi:hypothetical protein
MAIVIYLWGGRLKDIALEILNGNVLWYHKCISTQTRLQYLLRYDWSALYRIHVYDRYALYREDILAGSWGVYKIHVYKRHILSDNTVP